MYAEYYGFREKPFSLTPDPRYLFLSPGHQEALAHLEYGHQDHGGFMVLTGEVGTGKTTVARHFLASLNSRTATALVLYPVLSASELVRGVLRDLRVPAPDGASLKELVDLLHDFLLSARYEQRDVMLLIDEAQDLTAEVLEQIRLISNLETDTQKLIQIILVGQPELRTMMARPELRQLAQRVTARYHLGGLGRAECEAYIRHRLRIAGGEDKVVFAPAALSSVHRVTGGIPRLINLVCDRALLAGYVDGTRTITAGHVRRAAAELFDRPQRSRAPLTLLGCVMAVAFATVGAVRFWPRPAPQAPDGAVRASATAVARVPPAASDDALVRFLLSSHAAASSAEALRDIQTLWSTQPLMVTELTTHIEQVRRLDLPAVLEMAHPARRGTAFVAIVGLNGDEALLRAGPGRELRVPLAAIERHWTRRALYPWPAQAVLGARPDDAHREQVARSILATLGYDLADLDAAIRRFQHASDLVSDGTVGSRTLLALYAASERNRPVLVRRLP